jgi:Nuclease-related domain
MGRVMTLGTATTVAIRQVRGAAALDPLRILAAAAEHVHGWAATAEGRRRTARVLQSLDPGAWRVTQDIRLPDGCRADHLAVGPSGVYLLDSRAWLGVVTVDHKGATITPEGRPRRPGPHAVSTPRWPRPRRPSAGPSRRRAGRCPRRGPSS